MIRLVSLTLVLASLAIVLTASSWKPTIPGVKPQVDDGSQTAAVYVPVDAECDIAVRVRSKPGETIDKRLAEKRDALARQVQEAIRSGQIVAPSGGG